MLWRFLLWLNRFQSTPPARGATTVCQQRYTGQTISIHAPREGGDYVDTGISPEYDEFQSTPPARGATAACWRWV